MVKPKHHLTRHVAEDRIADAIRAAEAQTSGKILVTLSHHSRGDIIAAAMRAFARLEMHRAHQRNNVLFFVVPEQREFAVVGDAGIHKELGQSFWEQLARSIGEKIKAQDLTTGLVYGIEQVGRELATHYPRSKG